MIFTVAELTSASKKYLNDVDTDIDIKKVKYYIDYYGKLSHLKIRNQKKGVEFGEYISLEKVFIEHLISQYKLFENIDKEISLAYLCLIKGVSFIIRINESTLREANEISENFIREIGG